jgi:O-methyltransferase
MSALSAGQKIRRIAGRFLFPLRRLAAPAGGRHALVLPTASYAPWNSDEDFLRVYRVSREHTLVDELRCWELWQLVEQTRGLSGAIVEVGVWRGGTGILLASQAARLGLPEPVYLCDTFRGVVKATAQDSDYRGGEHADTSLERVRQLVEQRMGLRNVRLLQGIFPDDTAAQISEASVRLCHIDVDVYQSAADIMAWVWPRLCVGAVVVYDDYGFLRCDGIARHVDEQRRMADRVVIHNLNGHAIVIKTRP